MHQPVPTSARIENSMTATLHGLRPGFQVPRKHGSKPGAEGPDKIDDKLPQTDYDKTDSPSKEAARMNETGNEYVGQSIGAKSSAPDDEFATKKDLEILRSNLCERIALESKQLSEKISAVSKEVSALRQETSDKISAVSKEVSALRHETSDKRSALDDKLSDKISALDDKLSDKISALDDKLSDKISALNDKLISKYTIYLAVTILGSILGGIALSIYYLAQKIGVINI